MDRTLVVNPDELATPGKFLSRGGITDRVSRVAYEFWRGEPAVTRGVQRVWELNPALIHAHFGPEGARALPLARALRVPLLVTFHGYDATVEDQYAKPFYPQLQVYLRRREELKHSAGLFIAVSKFIRTKLLEKGFPPDKTVVHHIGIDTAAFQPDPAVPREPVVLFVGRLVEKKGLEYLIWAMSRVQAVMPEVELVVIGDGPLGPSLERLASEKLRRYRFLGVQSPESVRAWMNRAKVFSVPSVTAHTGDSEGFGMVFAEAQAMGLPVVSTLHAGVPEAVVHGKTGFLVAERNWEGIAEHILLLLKNDALWHRFSTAGQRRVRALFDLQKQTSVLEELYAQLLRTEAVKRSGASSAIGSLPYSATRRG
jgi:glycosyltransferase involved in cell wall biosynthesis